MERYIGHEIRKTDNMMKREFLNSDLKQEIDNITNSNGWIIEFLAENQDKDIFQRDLEKRFSVRRSTISATIKLMEKKGLIMRKSVDYDARLKKLVLTDKALDIHKCMIETFKQNEKKLIRGISENELDIFLDVLKKIQKNIQ